MMNPRYPLCALLAVAALPGYAQSGVTITGRVAQGIEQYSLSGQGSATMVSDNASRLIFKGTEDLGGGLKAFFQIDSRFRADDNASSAIASGNTGVGLQGGFGKLTLGRWDLHYNEGESLEKQKALSDQSWSTKGLLAQVNGTVIARVSRSSNVIKYDTPKLNGFNATLAYSSNPAGADGNVNADADKGGAYQAAVRYQNGPFDAGLSYWNYSVEGVTNAGDERSMRGWLGYRFPFGLSIGLVVDQSKRRPALNAAFQRRTAVALPITYAVGPHAVHFHYARAGDLNNTVNTSAKQWMLGYDFALSKRTTVGANYIRLTNEAAASYDFKSVSPAANQTANGEDARQLYLGIRHDF
ncbi:MAG: Outer membrane porin protein 32 precursor [Betaproteobacteria bacterium ADurb.Bin341]|nr:MAG: Outer membrane porin protein 32 precursor [Betaproteobacteria bacterium ADurb.Bin341]